MANSYVPYLQTLAKDEAIAFVASLQKVKEHLSHELQWMNEQVQQKTVQLQGIDTLLSEAVGLGLVPLHASSTQAPTASLSEANSSVAETVLPNASEAAPSAANGSNSVVNTAALSDLATSPSEAATTSTAPPQRGKQRQQSKSSRAKPDGKLPAAAKTNVAKTKPGRSAQAASASSQGSSAGFQQFLQSNFKDKSMTDAVGEILDASQEPMNTDAIMSKLYDGLAGDAYQRAKSSLSNILSVGKSKGRWKSTGRGLYTGS